MSAKTTSEDIQTAIAGIEPAELARRIDQMRYLLENQSSVFSGRAGRAPDPLVALALAAKSVAMQELLAAIATSDHEYLRYQATAANRDLAIRIAGLWDAAAQS